jgi:hypothetical protein
MVRPRRDAIPAGPLLLRCQCGWRVQWPPGLRNRQNGRCRWLFWLALVWAIPSNRFQTPECLTRCRIFILEGLLTVIVGIISYWTLYDFPDTAPFLTTEERAWVVHRLRYQGVSAESKKIAQANRFQWRYVKQAFTDPQIYIGLISAYPPF